MMQEFVALQRDIYLSLADQLRAFAAGGGWGALLLFLPMGILFGAVHALTPGHSKTVLATYVAGTPTGLLRGLLISLTLSVTHVLAAVLIALLALPLVTTALGGVGRAPLLEDVSRGLLGLIGLWMIWRALRPRRAPHTHGNGIAFGIMAGLIPCPLTLFAMTFAISRGVPEAGVAFALTMVIGVALTLSAVALATVLFRQKALSLLARRQRLLARAGRLVEGAAGLLLLLIAVYVVGFD